MPRHASARFAELPRLQERLLLNRYLCRQLGYEDFRALRDALSRQQEGWSNDGRSYFYAVLEGRQGCQIPPDRLRQYDAHIHGYQQRLNEHRERPVQLKYYQYLALLFTEIYLDAYFTDAARLLQNLEAFQQELGWKDYPQTYQPSDLRKLAFWMATGSGKTLLMHANLWQYLHYSAGKREHPNILLITPNEGLSEQHLRELERSGIRAERLSLGSSALDDGEPTVRVVEITKLGKERRGEGQTIPIDALGDANLVFVDEGHRGARGEVWRTLREQLAQNGFAFEYSATFGQIVNGAPAKERPQLLNEYAKAILFDYSYPHFYHDGYGKDYFILNLPESNEQFNETLLLANLLAYYEQLHAYTRDRSLALQYNIEKPLWIFVGHTVTGGSTDDKQSLTDVEEIVAFLNRYLKEPNAYAQCIGQILHGKSGLTNSAGDDLFTPQFPLLRQEYADKCEELYAQIVQQVFHGRPGDALRVVELKNASGELGLKAGGADSPYFGVINIGDAPKLRQRLEQKGILTDADQFTPSLFEAINAHDSRVNLLIGSRKFMEGWDSFRVSSIGLMNIGRGEGAQIIQLFGRGVRLWGKDYSLKRSAFTAEGAPPPPRAIETLQVYGIRANYMQQFRKYLENEGVTTDFETLALPVRVQSELLQAELPVLRLPADAPFVERQPVRLQVDGNLKVILDLRPRVQAAQSGQSLQQAKVSGSDLTSQLREWAKLLNWQRIYLQMLEHREERGWTNLVFTQDDLRQIVLEGDYEVWDAHPLPKTPAALRRAEPLALSLLQKYAALYYDRQRKAWETKQLQLRILTQDDPNLNFGAYTLRIAPAAAESIRNLLAQADRLYERDCAELPTLVFERHLYLPLLLADRSPAESATPPPLDAHEAQFVRDLRNYVQQCAAELNGYTLYLLRNLTRGKGIGFFSADAGEAFYPDFILWLVGDDEARIAFIDPHGLRMARGGFSEPKLQLHQLLESLILSCDSKSRCVKYTAFILSTTPYGTLKTTFGAGSHTKEEFVAHHVLFMEEPDYVGRLLSLLRAI